MDQDSFRQLLSTPGAATAASSSGQRGSLFSKTTAKLKTIDPSEPAFKPRKINKQSAKYRDRASERRGGLDHDFTQVEALLEDFEKQNKDNEDRLAIEEQRKYLGGDSDHSILVKGLDFALLEQNKAKAAATSAGEDDEILEQAFLEATSAPAVAEPSVVVPKKRTRQDLIRELKEKRSDTTAEDTKQNKDNGIEEAKKAGKFKPIGFKPIGDSDEKVTRKKKKQDKDRERKPKKRKINPAEQTKPVESEIAPPPPNDSRQVEEPAAKEVEPEQLDPDFDIFAGVGEYAGLDVDDEDEVESEKDMMPDHNSEPEPPSVPLTRGWFDEPKEPSPPPPAPEPSLSAKEPLKDEAEEDQQPMRLVPLTSSAVPSIQDILAMDKAAEREEKMKARKEKRKEKKELSAEGKASRDYQKLMAYEKKKSK